MQGCSSPAVKKEAFRTKKNQEPAFTFSNFKDLEVIFREEWFIIPVETCGKFLQWQIKPINLTDYFQCTFLDMAFFSEIHLYVKLNVLHHCHIFCVSQPWENYCFFYLMLSWSYFSSNNWLNMYEERRLRSIGLWPRKFSSLLIKHNLYHTSTKRIPEHSHPNHHSWVHAVGTKGFFGYSQYNTIQ